MAINMGQLLVDFIGLQSTPINIGNAVQQQLNSQGNDVSGYGIAVASTLHGLTTMATTLNQMPNNAWVKSLGAAGGLIALNGLILNNNELKKDLVKYGSITIKNGVGVIYQ